MKDDTSLLMDTIIAGTRSLPHAWWPTCFELIDGADSVQRITGVLYGGANGADRMGAMWAFLRDRPLYPYYADWNRYGKSAGYLRNWDMAEDADRLIAFWNGRSRGTRNMIDRAKSEGLIVEVIDYDYIRPRRTP